MTGRPHCIAAGSRPPTEGEVRESVGLGFGVWGLGFGVWGLGFGVWGLGFGVWGSGFRFGSLGLKTREMCVSGPGGFGPGLCACVGVVFLICRNKAEVHKQNTSLPEDLTFCEALRAQTPCLRIC